ncbi:MAG TPA: VOC family protein [Polyangia bacterium]|nr:VOC family protein [Polyangia bacterium]
MAAKVKPIPDGYHTLTPYLSIKGASDAIAFYKKAFGAEELVRMPMPDGTVAHAELQIGDSRLMLADENTMGDAVTKSPRALGGTSTGLCLYVPDVDALFKRAVEAGVKTKRPLANQFYGDRTATVEDPFGHVWTLMTHVEDVSPEEMKRRMAALPS